MSTLIFWFFVIEISPLTLSKSTCMYSVSFSGVTVDTSSIIISSERQAARGATYLWYSRGLSSPPYTDTSMSRQCSDRCPHSYMASLWYTRSHLHFNRKKNMSGTKRNTVCYLLFNHHMTNGCSISRGRKTMA